MFYGYSYYHCRNEPQDSEIPEITEIDELFAKLILLLVGGELA